VEQVQSESIAKLAEALSKAQGEMKAPAKTKTMKIPGRGDYRYADLADVIESRKVGAKHGLAITQGMEMSEDGLSLTTTLMHLSGEWKSWACPIPAGLKPQELGSYLTYMRRYSECGAWGIAAEDDDDGATAQQGTPAPQAQRTVQPQQRPPAQRAAANGSKPECSACGTAEYVIASKFKEGEYLCYEKKGGCGRKFRADGSSSSAPPPNLPSDYPGDFQVTDEDVPF
jgi:hypothetical protein